MHSAKIVLLWHRTPIHIRLSSVFCVARHEPFCTGFLIFNYEKMNTHIITIFTVVVLFVGFLWVVLPDKNNSNSLTETAAVLNAEETSFDFGLINMAAGKVKHQFKVKNTGSEPIIIEKVFTSCMCTNAYVTSGTGKRYGAFGMPGHSGPSQTTIEVAPEDTIIVEAIFDPAAHGPSGVGHAQRSIYLETNSVTSPRVELSFQATVTR